MEEDQFSEDSLTTELKNLGENLKNTLRTVWESEERKKVHSEIEDGISELGNALREATSDLETSEVGQEIKSGVKDVRQRLESGEVETRLRQDLLKALQVINKELDQVQARWAATVQGAATADSEASAGTQDTPAGESESSDG